MTDHVLVWHPKVPGEAPAGGDDHKAAKEKHFMHLEGKDYIVKDGDIIFFLFNV